MMLSVKGLQAEVEGKQILTGLDLEVGQRGVDEVDVQHLRGHRVLGIHRPE